MLENRDVITEIEAEERKQALSIPAKRLRDKLLPLKSKVEQTAKRWFWELLQNASDYNHTVDVRLEIDDNHLVFKHTGNPFSIQDVLNLISPDSGKDKDEVKKENIGKFGSGLVSTHILSAEMKVNGAFKSDNEDKLYKFDVVLDRGVFEDKESLIKSIETTKQGFKEIQSSIDKSEYSGFMTSFSYNLKKQLPSLSSSVDVVALGLEQIYDVLPYTLCFMTKVQSVEIIDNRAKTSIRNFQIVRKQGSNSLQKFEIEENQQTVEIEFVKLKYKQVETVYSHKEGKIQPLPKSISKLFCGLPMIGSENIGLPLILNSFDFEPTLEREGVEITPNDTLNRSLFSQAIELYKLLMNDIAQKELDNGYHLTKLNYKYHGVEGSKNIFKRDYVPCFQKIIEASRIVKNSKGKFISFSEILIPYKEGKAFPELFQHASEIKSSRFPSINSYEGWIDATDFLIFPRYKYDLKTFIEEISKTQQIQAFVLDSDIDVLKWLRGIACMVNEENVDLFSHYAILPNQKGGLRKSKEIVIDSDIPPELKAIFNKLSTEEIELSLLDKSFNEFTNVVDKAFDISHICKKIDDLLKVKYSKENGSTASFSVPLNDLYKWISSSAKKKEELEDLFDWFYPKRATLFMDTFGVIERDYAFTIVQSGKIKALAALAESDITSEELEYISQNPEVMSKLYALLQSEIDDNQNANSETGRYGENLVFNDLRQKYNLTDGYEVIWSSKNGEARFDFEVKHKGRTVLFVDAKTTMRGISNSDSIPFFMRNSQWEFLPTIEIGVKYLIARVFKKENLIKYLQINTYINGL
jgi:hypothetical protein